MEEIKMKKIFAMIVIVITSLTVAVWGASKTYLFPSEIQCTSCLNEMKTNKRYNAAFTCITEKKKHFMSYLPPNMGDKTVGVKTSDDKTEKIKLSAKSIKLTESDVRGLCPSVYKQIENSRKKK